MITALITTSINVPKVLQLYRAFGLHVPIFITGDQKTPKQAWDLCKSIPHCYYYPIDTQDKLYPDLSKAIGYNTIARRNIALLEALKAGAQIIVTVDDDNFPLNRNYFQDFNVRFGGLLFSGPQVHAPSRWFDVGQLLDPPASHRGFPLEADNYYEVEHVTNAKIGVAAGVCIGDPDISAITRIARTPLVQRRSCLLESGISVSQSTWTVFNSQNTAFVREIAPCFLMLPQVGRYDDILASIVAQKVMHKRDMQVFFGPPFVWQQRNFHSLLGDLKKELWGYENIWVVANTIDRIKLLGKSVIADVEDIYLAISTQLPGDVMPLVELWLAELEKIDAPKERQVPENRKLEHT